MKNIEQLKVQFLDMYNYDRSISVALEKSINAAVQHNLLYAKNITNKDRKLVREFWSENLKEVGSEFKNCVDISTYELMVANLSNVMNKKFGSLFDSNSKFGSMFRISHSQKSISVFVKHMWCMNLIPEPKICPVDRVILNQTEARKNKDVAWGYVNSIEEHRRKFQYIQATAHLENLSVAQWELRKFNPK